MQEIKTVFDTLYLLRSDTATNTKIYYNETIKLIEGTNWISIYIPIFIAVLALFVSCYQIFMIRKENRLKAKPLLLFKHDSSLEKILSIKLYNAGHVATITSLLFTKANKQNINFFKLLKETQFVYPIKMDIKQSEIELLSFLKEGDEEQILKLTFPEDIKDYLMYLKDYKIKILFEDIYGRKGSSIVSIV